METQHATSLEEVPKFLLDEWATAYQFDPIQEALEIGLGTYCILESDSPIPNLIKGKEDIEGLWSMFFDGS